MKVRNPIIIPIQLFDYKNQILRFENKSIINYGTKEKEGHSRKLAAHSSMNNSNNMRGKFHATTTRTRQS